MVLSTSNGQLDVGDATPLTLRVEPLAVEAVVQEALHFRDPMLDSNSGGDVVRLHAEYYARAR